MQAKLLFILTTLLKIANPFDELTLAAWQRPPRLTKSEHFLAQV